MLRSSNDEGRRGKDKSSDIVINLNQSKMSKSL